jgi:hypothetical protein
MSRKTFKPLLLKIIGFIFVGVAIFGVANIIIGIKTLSVQFTIGLYSVALGAIICIPCLADGFRPEIERSKAKKAEKLYQPTYTEESTLPDEEEYVADPDALNDIEQAIKDIVVETIEQNTVNTNEGKKPIKYCIECGCAIDKNSNYCKICGREQE